MQEWPTANKKRKAIHFCSRQLGSSVYRVPALTAFDRLAVCFHIRRNALVESCSYLVRKGGLEPPRFYPPDPKFAVHRKQRTYTICDWAQWITTSCDGFSSCT